MSNPPFATTQNWWDEAIDWPSFFKEAFRVLKDDGMLLIHCSIPFNYTLIRAAPKPPHYSWYWKKPGTTLALCAKVQPLRCVEEILVWKNKKNRYYAKRVGDKMGTEGGRYKTSYVNESKIQETKKVKGTYITHFLDMKREIRGFATRSDDMVKLFLEAYTKEGDVVLDPTCYKGLTGRICSQMGRKWIGIDKYFYPTEWILQKSAPSASAPPMLGEALPQNELVKLPDVPPVADSVLYEMTDELFQAGISCPPGTMARQSPIHGIGIFATRAFKKDEVIGEHTGTYMKHKEFKELYGNDRSDCYFRERQWDYRVDKHKKCFISWMNDGRFGNGPGENVVLRNWNAVAKRDIAVGEELLLYYGWKHPLHIVTSSRSPSST